MRFRLTILLSLFLSSCGLFSSEEPNLGVCQEGLFSIVQEEGSVSLIVELDVEYVSESELSEDQKLAQRARINMAQDQLISNLNNTGFIYNNLRKFETRPIIVIRVEEKALFFVCNYESVYSVSENGSSFISQ